MNVKTKKQIKQIHDLAIDAIKELVTDIGYDPYDDYIIYHLAEILSSLHVCCDDFYE